MRPLLSLVRIDDPGIRAVLNDWLGTTFVADDIAQALASRAQLPEGGAFVVKAGHMVTRVGVRFTPPIPSRPACSRASRKSRT